MCEFLYHLEILSWKSQFKFSIIIKHTAAAKSRTNAIYMNSLLTHFAICICFFKRNHTVVTQSNFAHRFAKCFRSGVVNSLTKITYWFIFLVWTKLLHFFLILWKLNLISSTINYKLANTSHSFPHNIMIRSNWFFVISYSIVGESYTIGAKKWIA